MVKVARMARKNGKNRFGFTLVELLIVISIIGVLAGFLFVNFAEIRVRGRDSRRKSDLAEVKKALRLYYNDFQTYPNNDEAARILGCGSSGTEVCQWGDEFATDTTSYMGALPIDPLNIGTQVYSYARTSGGEDFQLWVPLENASDQQAVQSQERCGVDEDDIEEGVFMVCGN